MRRYEYLCPHCKHRQEEAHSWPPPIIYCQECGAVMHRVPQRPVVAFNATDILLDWMDENYIRKRTGQPLFSEYKVNRPGARIPRPERYEKK
jgi:hypothetical protein